MVNELKKPVISLDSYGKPNSKESSMSSSVFSTLFGEIPQQDCSFTSLFSENNPFRRKHEFGQGFEANKVEIEDAVSHSDSARLKEPKKRKKVVLQNEKTDSDAEDIEIKKLKGNESIGVSKNTEDVNFGVEIEKKKKKKRKIDDVEAEYEASRYGIPNDVDEKKGGSNAVVGEKRKKMENPEISMVPKEGFDDESKLLRTIFVGNLPLKVKKKVLMKEFGKFGEVESVRIRSVPIADGTTPRKGAVIRNQINEKGDSVHAYIVFKTEESAQASLSHNMAVVGGNHIRVDRACPPRKKLKGDEAPLYDSKRTAFVGNLPFDVKDEELYQLFCGIKNLETSVEAVRVIRDSGSSLGKGIAYVLFKTTDAVNIVTKRSLRIRNRELRISRVKLDSSKTSSKSSGTPTNHQPPAKKFASDSKSSLSYQGLRASKSGAQKKINTKKMMSTSAARLPSAKEETPNKQKRPAVAARKEKAKRQAASASGSTTHAGVKRKFANRTPQSTAQKKKPRTFR